MSLKEEERKTLVLLEIELSANAKKTDMTDRT
jgi:hypothetical protein